MVRIWLSLLVGMLVAGSTPGLAAEGARISALPLVGGIRGPSVCGMASAADEETRMGFCRDLQEFRERPSFAVDSPRTRSALRTLMTPSFRDNLLIRTEFYSESEGMISVRVGHYNARQRRTELRWFRAELGANDIQNIQAVVVTTDFWNLPVRATFDMIRKTPDGGSEIYICGDGYGVAIEGLEAGRYHLSHGGCDQVDELRAISEVLIGLVNRKFPEIETDWFP